MLKEKKHVSLILWRGQVCSGGEATLLETLGVIIRMSFSHSRVLRVGSIK